MPRLSFPIHFPCVGGRLREGGRREGKVEEYHKEDEDESIEGEKKAHPPPGGLGFPEVYGLECEVKEI